MMLQLYWLVTQNVGGVDFKAVWNFWFENENFRNLLRKRDFEEKLVKSPR